MNYSVKATNSDGSESIRKSGNIPYQQEVLRKAIHLVSLSIPIGYSFLSKELALSILVPLTIIAIVIDVLLKRKNVVGEFIYKYFGAMLRPHEKNNKVVLNGASWVLISASLCVLIFPKLLAVTGFAVLIISDICAALFGRKYGKTPLFDKSWEGTSAFIISAFTVVIIIGILLNAPWTYFLFGFLGAFISAFVEAGSNYLKIDDNLGIPVSIALIMWGGNYIAGYFNAVYLNIL